MPANIHTIRTTQFLSFDATLKNPFATTNITTFAKTIATTFCTTIPSAIIPADKEAFGAAINATNTSSIFTTE